MFKEKLSPVLGLALVADIDEAIDMARWMLARGGAGHTSGIHSSCERQAAIGRGFGLLPSRGEWHHDQWRDRHRYRVALHLHCRNGLRGEEFLGVNMGIEPWLDYKRVAFPLSATSAQSADGAGHVNSDQVRHLIKEELAAMRAQG